MNNLPTSIRNLMVVSSNNYFSHFCLSEVPPCLFLWSHTYTQRHIFPCVNRLCEWSPGLVRGLLSSTLSHAQVCSTIVDRISSGLPVSPYCQHFSIQSSFNWDADVARQNLLQPINSYFHFLLLSKFYIQIFVSFLRNVKAPTAFST